MLDIVLAVMFFGLRLVIINLRLFFLMGSVLACMRTPVIVTVY